MPQKKHNNKQKGPKRPNPKHTKNTAGAAVSSKPRKPATKVKPNTRKQTLKHAPVRDQAQKSALIRHKHSLSTHTNTEEEPHIPTHIEVLTKGASSGLGSTKEIRYHLVDYFDLEHPSAVLTSNAVTKGIHQYFIDQRATLLSANADVSMSSKSNFTRILRVDFYAMNNFINTSGDTDPSITTSMMCFTVPALTVTTDSGAIATNYTATSTQQQTTILLPSSIQKWHHCGTFRESVFHSTELSPQTTSIVDGQPEGTCVGALAVLNPDSGELLLDNPVQIKVVMTLQETVPTIVSIPTTLAWTTSNTGQYWNDLVGFTDGNYENPNVGVLNVSGSKKRADRN